MTYSEKLKDPRWQRKRLAILDRDNFTCQHCQDTTKTLHVHHLDYLHGKEPWDYDDTFLLTLCEDCHQAETDGRPGSEKIILRAIRLNFKSDFDRHSLFRVLDMPQADHIFYLLEELTQYPSELEEALKQVIITKKKWGNPIENA